MQPEDRWEWIGEFETLTGTFNVFDPQPGDITIFEIANALSNICRYNGHVMNFYSVADHSVRVMNEVVRKADGAASDRLLRTALLHDAAEAYIGDMIRPLKRHPEFGAGIRDADERITRIICQKYDAIYPIPTIVEEADRDVYYWERENIRTGRVEGLKPRDARRQFVRAFNAVYPNHLSTKRPDMDSGTT